MPSAARKTAEGECIAIPPLFAAMLTRCGLGELQATPRGNRRTGRGLPFGSSPQLRDRIRRPARASLHRPEALFAVGRAATCSLPRFFHMRWIISYFYGFVNLVARKKRHTGPERTPSRLEDTHGFPHLQFPERRSNSSALFRMESVTFAPPIILASASIRPGRSSSSTFVYVRPFSMNLEM